MRIWFKWAFVWVTIQHRVSVGWVVTGITRVFSSPLVKRGMHRPDLQVKLVVCFKAHLR